MNSFNKKQKTKISAEGQPGNPGKVGSYKTSTQFGGASSEMLPIRASTSKAAQKPLISEFSPVIIATGAAKPTGLSATPNPALTAIGATKPIGLHVTPGPTSTVKNRKAGERRAFIERRAALRLVERLGNKSLDQLSEEDKTSLTWARATLEKQGDSNPSKPAVGKPAEKGMPKRQRSEDTTSPPNQPEAKRQRQNIVAGNRPFSEVARNPLVRAIIDRNVSDGSISHEKWVLVNQKSLEVYWKILKENPGTPPQNYDAGWYQGRIKLMECCNERSAHLLQLAMASIGEVWPGAKLDVVPVSEIPRRPRATAVVPAEPHDPEEILAMIQMGNPDLHASDWKVVRVSPVDHGARRIVVSLTKDTLESLRKKQGHIHYGFGSVRLSVYRGDDKNDVSSRKDADTADSHRQSECSGDTLTDDCESGSHSGTLIAVSDEDALLDTDSEDANITIVCKHGGEGDTDKPTPL